MSSETATSSEPPADSGIKFIEIRVRNFRSLRHVDVSLGDVTVLVGANNAGKTSLLEALSLAIGLGRRAGDREDIYFGPTEASAPRDRKATIDFIIRPTDADGNVVSTFPSGDYWLGLWGNGVQQDSQDNDFVAIRTVLEWDPIRNEYSTSRQFLLDWPDSHRWAEARTRRGFVTANQIEPISLHLLDAQRDLQSEFSNRGSYWNRLVADLDLPIEIVDELEASLTDLNKRIVEDSPVLRHIGTSLQDLMRSVAGTSEISLTPLPMHLRDLSRGMDVQFAAEGGPTLPLGRHGMGTRSLAAILVFRAYATWRMGIARDQGESTHPMLGLEEPEAHLHPHAQRAIGREIEEMPGHRLVSTHSPVIAGRVALESIRLFRKEAAETVVSSLADAGWDADERETVQRKVLATRGELLFARAVVLLEGETEEYSLPVFAEARWSDSPQDLGVSFVSVGGDGAYTPFVRLARSLAIPWFIFSDGGDSVARVKSQLTSLGIDDAEAAARTVTIPNGLDFEEYLANEYTLELRDAIVDRLAQSDEQRDALMAGDWADGPALSETVAAKMTDDKVRYGQLASATIVRLTDVTRRIPPAIADTLAAVEAATGILPQEASP